MGSGSSPPSLFHRKRGSQQAEKWQWQMGFLREIEIYPTQPPEGFNMTLNDIPKGDFDHAAIPGEWIKASLDIPPRTFYEKAAEAVKAHMNEASLSPASLRHCLHSSDSDPSYHPWWQSRVGTYWITNSENRGLITAGNTTPAHDKMILAWWTGTVGALRSQLEIQAGYNR